MSGTIIRALPTSRTSRPRLSAPLSVEALEARTVPSVTVSGFNPTTGTVTFTGDGGGDPNDHLVLSAVDVDGPGFALAHNLTDPNLEGNTDLDPNTPGVQQLILGSGSAPLITVNLLTGDDFLRIDGTDVFSSFLSVVSTPVRYDGGSGRDQLWIDTSHPNLMSGILLTWNLTGANTGSVTHQALDAPAPDTVVEFTGTEDLKRPDGSDRFVFAPGGSVGRIDGGDRDVLDYSALSSPVEVFVSGGSATHTTGISGFRRVIGGSADDLLVGSDAADVLTGGAGDDILIGGAGNDVLTGDAGDDVLTGGAGDDVLTGGAGNDLFVGGDGFDKVKETFIAARAITLTNTSLRGGAATGADTLRGVEGAELSVGFGPGARNVVMNAAAFTLGPVTLTGGAGNDRLLGGIHGDDLSGRGGHDTLVGGRGNDLLWGGPGSDVLNGGAGDDTAQEGFFSGPAGVFLTTGRLRGSDGFGRTTDTLISIDRALLVLQQFNLGADSGSLNAAGFRAGPVTLIGGAGNDTLIGTNHAGDSLVGGAGNDTLNSGLGADTVDGGPGLDLHVTLGGAGQGDLVSNVP